ncbi:protein mab-21-like 3 isoform 1-T1 [Pluvialis apricaria]
MRILRISQLYWPSGQPCFEGSAHSTHPSRYKAFLPPGACRSVYLLPPHPPSSPDNFTHLTDPPMISSSPQKTCVFCSKHKDFISNLILLPPWDILARITKMSLYLICPAYCRQVFNIAELAISYTSQNSRLLFNSLGLAGAHGLHTVLAPSQFLITVPLRGLTGYRERQVRHWRYYTVHGAKLLSSVRDPEELHQWLEVEQFSKSLQQWHETDVNIEGDLVPAKVLIVFRELVEKSIISCNLSSKVTVLESFSSVVRVAVETSESQVEVELVPAVEIPTCWPEKARWPRCLKRWPSQEKVQCIKSLGFDLLARSNYHWQLCFSRAERILMEGLDEDGGCRMKCFRVMRQMKEDVWCAGNKPVITAYHLQTVLFWTCEKYPRTKDWRCFPEAFLRLVQKLHKCVSQHFLKHYFVKNTNLLKYANTSDLDLVASKLAVFLENPVFCLD